MCQLKVTETNLLSKRYQYILNEKKRLEPTIFFVYN